MPFLILFPGYKDVNTDVIKQALEKIPIEKIASNLNITSWRVLKIIQR